MFELIPLLDEGFRFASEDLAAVIAQDIKPIVEFQRTTEFAGYPAEFLADFPDFSPEDHRGK